LTERPAPFVIKIGGSVLTGPKAYPRAARWLARRWRGPEGLRAPLLVIVSAENGVTDRLLAEAESIVAQPDPRALDLLWLVEPMFKHTGFPIHWMDAALPIGLVGVWTFLFARHLRSRSLLPLNDPFFKEAFAHDAH
jgi:hypothetical protein